MCCVAHIFDVYGKDQNLSKDVVKHLLKTILHDLRWYMNFITLIVFSIPSTRLGVYKHNLLDKNHNYTIANQERSYMYLIILKKVNYSQHVYLS